MISNVILSSLFEILNQTPNIIRIIAIIIFLESLLNQHVNDTIKCLYFAVNYDHFYVRVLFCRIFLNQWYNDLNYVGTIDLHQSFTQVSTSIQNISRPET